MGFDGDHFPTYEVNMIMVDILKLAPPLVKVDLGQTLAGKGYKKKNKTKESERTSCDNVKTHSKPSCARCKHEINDKREVHPKEMENKVLAIFKSPPKNYEPYSPRSVLQKL